MKKPKNFDKLNKIKFSDIGIGKINPYVYTMEGKEIDISNVTIYNASPKTVMTKKDVYNNLSTIVLINESTYSGDELVIKINWTTQVAKYYKQVKDTYKRSNRGFTSKERELGSKNFFLNQARTMEGFIQMVILPIVIQSVESNEWSIDIPTLTSNV